MLSTTVINRGVARVLDQQLEAAVADFQLALSLDPEKNAASVYLNLAVAKTLMGNTDAAQTEFSRALEFDPAMAEVYATRAKFLLQTCNEPERALLDFVTADFIKEAGE